MISLQQVPLTLLAQCARNLRTALRMCESLGLSLHPGKCMGPSAVMTVLGIELDSMAQVARLPDDKLLALQDMVNSCLPRKWCTRRGLESFIGQLHHAAQVVWPGRTFLRWMIDLLCCFRTKDHPIRLNREFHLDLQWWVHLLHQWHVDAVDGVSAPSCMRVRIKASKTDPFRKGAEIYIGRGVYPLFAVEAMMAYLMQRGNAPGPLFLLQDGRPLSRVCLTDWLRQILSAAGFQGNFSGHSVRIGAATVAAPNRVPDHLIQALGRWSSNAYQLYIHTIPKRWLLSHIS